MAKVLTYVNKLRSKRRQLAKKIIGYDDNYDDFEYVVVKKKQSKLCFGTMQPRQIKMTFGKPGGTGPGKYNPKYWTKPTSKKGTLSLAKRTYLHSITPAPNRYTTEPWKPYKQMFYPFNNCTGRFKIYDQELPGPTVYNAHKVKKCKRTRMDYNFGNVCLVPAVECVCINYPTEKCEKCLTPFEFGDFWHKNHQNYLCNFCMNEEHRLHELYTRNELLTFKKIRTCAHMHRHEGTSASIKLLTQRQLDKKIRTENYLYLYFECHGTKSRTELVVPLNDVM